MIIKNNVSEQLFEILKKDIQSGKWKATESIPSEKSLVEEHQVSRSTVRDSIQRLVALGWLEKSQGKRTFVRKREIGEIINVDMSLINLNNNELLKVIEFRSIIEPEVASLAAKNATTENLDKMEFHLNRMNELDKGSKEFTEEDFEFHLEIAKATKNELIVNTLLLLKNIISDNVTDLNKISDDIISVHREIFKAIKSKNSLQAKKIIENHISVNRNKLKKMEEI